MKKTIVKFGLISGAVSSALMLSTVPFIYRIGFDRSMYVGYTCMVLAFLLVYFGIRSYRDNLAGGEISYGKAFLIGLGIAAISCVCYVVTWEVLYMTVMHDFVDKYSAYMVQQVRAAGGSEAAVQQKLLEMKRFKEMYANPLFNVAMTFIEPLPVGLVITLISAGLLRRKKSAGEAVAVGA